MTIDKQEAQKRSSAVTLSDMEMFIFPELIYGLVLANIMSPRIWRWRDDPWFDGLERMKPYRRISRLKQYIMDHYKFNLDLDTWGLTQRDVELARFSDFIDADTLAGSNALFGYEGDKYYFDIDIRSHFGLDKYTTDIIPYWKTETVEAMDAFQFKPGYRTGAGECVSLATLYAAALFVVARIPLKDIFLMATPLHSQNFVDVDDGILTNNRRLVTKNMWFNGTELSAQARRALENERVTIVAHESGVVHTVYDQASIDTAEFERFGKRLSDYLQSPLTVEILGNFLRQNSRLQKCFMMRWPVNGRDSYISMNRVFAYEHGSSYRVTDRTRAKLMDEIDEEEFLPAPCCKAIILNELEEFVKQHRPLLCNDDDVAELNAHFSMGCMDGEIAIEQLVSFCRTLPRLPEGSKKDFVSEPSALGLDFDMTRDEVIERLLDIRERNALARYAFYAFRDLSRTEVQPFLDASLCRNPVSRIESQSMSDEELLSMLSALPDESIYDESHRLAQPDEVWNFGRGDGLEKILTAANVLRSRHTKSPFRIRIDSGKAELMRDGSEVASLPTAKTPADTDWDLSVVAPAPPLPPGEQGTA